MSTQVYNLIPAWNVGGQFAQNVIHYQFDDAGFASTFQAADALITQWEAHSQAAWLALLPVDTVLLSIKSRRVSAVGGFDALHAVGAGTHGSRSGNLEVAACGPCIISYQANNGKKRGRIFLPGITENDVNEGVISDNLRAAFASNAGAMIADLNLVGGGGPTAKFCIYTHATHSGALVSGIQMSMTIATQRRRQLPA